MIEDHAVADVKPAEANRPEGDGPDVIVNLFEADEVTGEEVERGKPVSLPLAARALLEALDRWVGELEGGLRKIRKAWNDRSAILGREVRVREGGRTCSGVVEGLDPIEGLEVRLSAGPVRHFRGEHVEHLELV